MLVTCWPFLPGSKCMTYFLHQRLSLLTQAKQFSHNLKGFGLVLKDQAYNHTRFSNNLLTLS